MASKLHIGAKQGYVTFHNSLFTRYKHTGTVGLAQSFPLRPIPNKHLALVRLHPEVSSVNNDTRSFGNKAYSFSPKTNPLFARPSLITRSGIFGLPWTNQAVCHAVNSRTMKYSTGTGTPANQSEKPSDKTASPATDSSVAKLKRAFKDYGSTIIVFHVGISLMSLGGFYLAVSSGLDVDALIHWVGFSDNAKVQAVLAGSSTFLVAFAIHKLFAPVRISITLATAPFLVRYLRKVGILKAK